MSIQKQFEKKASCIATTSLQRKDERKQTNPG